MTAQAQTLIEQIKADREAQLSEALRDTQRKRNEALKLKEKQSGGQTEEKPGT